MRLMSQWNYDSDVGDDASREYAMSTESSSGDSDAEMELREMEELLYSQIHYGQNTLFRLEDDDDLEPVCNVKEIVVSTVNVGGVVTGIPAVQQGSLEGGKALLNHGEETQDCSDAWDHQKADLSECSIIDVPIDSVEIPLIDLCSDEDRNDMTPILVRKKKGIALKRKVIDGEGDDSRISHKRPMTKTKKPPARSAVVVCVESDMVQKNVSPQSKAGQCKLLKLTKKAKQKLGRAIETSVKNILDSKSTKVTAVEAESYSSSDLFCADDLSSSSSASTSSSSSSLDLATDEDDDIKVNSVQINGLSLSSLHAERHLKEILDSLPDCGWEVDAPDRCAGTPAASRYYQPLAKVRCGNCSERGHVASTCPVPKKVIACILCGVRGHISRCCPDAVCFNCHHPGHSLRDCDHRRRRTEFCRRCAMRGHTNEGCPDMWRQYHLTTTAGQLIKGKHRETLQKFCYNCAAEGHFGHECNEERSDHFVQVMLPFITRYDEPTRNENQQERLFDRSMSSGHRKDENWKKESYPSPMKHSSDRHQTELHQSRWDRKSPSGRFESGPSSHTTEPPSSRHGIKVDSRVNAKSISDTTASSSQSDWHPRNRDQKKLNDRRSEIRSTKSAWSSSITTDSQDSAKEASSCPQINQGKAHKSSTDDIIRPKHDASSSKISRLAEKSSGPMVGRGASGDGSSSGTNSHKRPPAVTAPLPHNQNRVDGRKSPCCAADGLVNMSRSARKKIEWLNARREERAKSKERRRAKMDNEMSDDKHKSIMSSGKDREAPEEQAVGRRVVQTKQGFRMTIDGTKNGSTAIDERCRQTRSPAANEKSTAVVVPKEKPKNLDSERETAQEFEVQHGKTEFLMTTVDGVRNAKQREKRKEECLKQKFTNKDGLVATSKSGTEQNRRVVKTDRGFCMTVD